MGKKLKNMTDTNLLLTITIVVFFVMYIGAIVFQGKGFLKPQTFFNILNANAALNRYFRRRCGGTGQHELRRISGLRRR